MIKYLFLLLLVVASSLEGVDQRRLVVYYAKWSDEHPNYPLSIDRIPIDLVTDFVYAFVDVDKEGNISVSVEEKRQLAELFSWKTKAQAQGYDVKTIFSVGGWGEGSEPLPALAANNTSRENFAKQARKFCQQYHFDGVDIDWEFPESHEEGKHFFLLMLDLYQQLKQSFHERYMLTIAAPGLPDDYKKINWSQVAPLIDRISVMCYDLHGPWKDPDNLVTNHQSALKATIVGNPAFNTSATMKFYAQHIPHEKLAVGIPLFFTAYAGAKEGIPPFHYGSAYTGPAKNPYVPYEEGELFYRDIVNDISGGRAKGYWDPIAVAFMAYYPQNNVFASGMNEEAIRRVCQFIIDNGFQGAKVWQFIGDTPSWQALRLINHLLL